jgi:hypothetical protein
MNSPAGEPQGPKRAPLPVRRGEGEATPRSLSALIQRQWGWGEGERSVCAPPRARLATAPPFHAELRVLSLRHIECRAIRLPSLSSTTARKP